MEHQVYKLSEIVGASTKGTDDAIRVALERAGQSIRNIRWFEVQNSRGYVGADGKITHQVTLKIGFALDD